MDYRELEEALCRLEAVDAIRVVGNGKAISEVHVLAGTEKSPKQVVRDVQSLAMARFGISIDHRIVSVVQLQAPGQRELDRPAVVGIRELPEGAKTIATVTLSWRGRQHVGETSGPRASATRLRLIGEAALRALEDTLAGPAFALEAVGVTTVGTRQVALAEVVTVADGEEAVMVGSALVRNDPAEAVVRAVLDALNRRVPHLSR